MAVSGHFGALQSVSPVDVSTDLLSYDLLDDERTPRMDQSSDIVYLILIRNVLYIRIISHYLVFIDPFAHHFDQPLVFGQTVERFCRFET